MFGEGTEISKYMKMNLKNFSSSLASLQFLNYFNQYNLLIINRCEISNGIKFRKLFYLFLAIVKALRPNNLKLVIGVFTISLKLTKIP